MEDLVKEFVEGTAEAQRQLYSEIVMNHGLYKDFHTELKKQLYDKNKKYYYYMITFTLKDSIKDLGLIKTIQKFIEGQVLRPALRIKEAHIVKELTKKGQAHWHVAVKAEQYIAKNRFNYYQKNYGNIDVSKNHGNTMTEMLNYMNKDNQSTKLK